jgi:hypothetical protein
MKRHALFLICAITLVAYGQGKLMHDGSGDPSGFCNNAVYINTATKEHWTCSNNAWSKDSAGSVPTSNLIYRATAISVNSANTDVGTFTGLPSKYIVRRLTFDNASGTPTLATISLRTAASGSGSAIVSGQALAGLSSTAIFLDSTLAISTNTQTANTLYLRNVVAAGSGITCDATLEIMPLP